MMGSIYLAASGAILQQMRLEIIANNVANVNTPGYKADLPIFRLQGDEAGLPTVNNNQPAAQRQNITPYTPPFGVRTDFSTGSIKSTGNALDLAISGDAFFTIQAQDGVRYTRQGNFRLNDEGTLVTQNGEPVLGQGAEITIAGGKVSVGADGTVQVDGQVIDQIRLVRFEDLSQLKKVGNTFFGPADGFGPEIEQEAENATIHQGFIEVSNVNAIRSMTDLIETLRVSEAYQKVIQTADEATSKAVNDVPGI